MTINNPDPNTAHRVEQQPSNCKIESCASPKGPQIVTMHDTPTIQNPKAFGLPNNNNVEERQWQTRDTPTKATCTTKVYGLQRDVAEAWTGQHLEDNLHLTPPSTTSVRPPKGTSPIRIQKALYNASDQNIATDMSDKRQQPEPGNPNHLIYLPVPSESDSEQDIHPTPSKTNMDDTPSKATFTTKNYGLQGETNHDFENISHITSTTTNARHTQGNPHTQTQVPLDNASGQSTDVDMKDTTLQPGPGYPTYPIYLPLPSESGSEPEGHTTPSTMTIG